MCHHESDFNADRPIKTVCVSACVTNDFKSFREDSAFQSNRQRDPDSKNRKPVRLCEFFLLIFRCVQQISIWVQLCRQMHRLNCLDYFMLFLFKPVLI